jgi:hypothetical protein
MQCTGLLRSYRAVTLLTDLTLFFRMTVLENIRLRFFSRLGHQGEWFGASF